MTDVDDVALWYDAPSLTVAARLAARVLADVERVDVRAGGVRVVAPRTATTAVSSAARELGLTADPSVPQRLSVVVGSPRPDVLASWWERVLGHAPGDGEPPLSFVPSDEPRPLRDRWHLDVVRPAAVVTAVAPGEGGAPYGVRHADPDGNEVDLVPGDPLAGAGDWQGVFSAIACYRVGSVEQQRALLVAAADLAETAGFPLLVGARRGQVVLDSGKDRADPDAHGLDLDFTALAADLQRVARDLGAEPDPTAPCFVQVMVDAADVDGVRAFWAAALGYVPDRRDGLTDLVDPRRLGPVVLLQPLDPGETERRRQRNRIHLELAVAGSVLRGRVDAAVAAGGRVIDEVSGRVTLVDPEDNELVLGPA